MIRRHDLTNKYKDKYNDNDKWHWLQFWQLGIWIWQLWHWTAFAILAMFLHFVENNFYLLEMGRSNMVVPEKQTYKSNQSSECLFPISKYTQTGIGHEQPQFDVPLCWNWKGPEGMRASCVWAMLARMGFVSSTRGFPDFHLGCFHLGTIHHTFPTYSKKNQSSKYKLVMLA